MTHKTFDPKEPREFSCTDDHEINTGSNQEDFNPPRIGNWREENEIENPDADDFDSGDWGGAV